MNRFFFITGLIFINYSNSFAVVKSEIKKIEILYVGTEIETPYRITCENFATVFKNDVKRTKIENRIELMRFKKYLDSKIIAKGSKEIDVRIKVIIYMADKSKKILCIDQFDNILFNGELLIYDKDILSFIAAHIKRKDAVK